mmetsp:Transcript_39531/g.77221  ORF Transcript_39531/g.77221 Transcript_39531/m.77221 type:complete len:581 (-) Transcript_39531:447-2189(-)
MTSPRGAPRKMLATKCARMRAPRINNSRDLPSRDGSDVVFEPGEKVDVSRHELEVEAPDLDDYFDLESAACQLGFASKGIATMRMADSPPFDIDDEYNQEHYMENYEVQRRPCILKGSLGEHGSSFIEHIMDNSRDMFPDSSWVMLWENHHEGGGGDITVLAQEHCEEGELTNVEEMIRTGELHGCELRGNPETSQFGLVATDNLQKGSVVAVECGILWTEPEHDAMVKSAGDPMVGLTSNYIPFRILNRMARRRNAKETKIFREDGNGPSGFVMDSSTHGNETKHIDDPCWIFMGVGNADGSNVPKPNLSSHVVLDLKRGLPTVCFVTNRTVGPGTELTMDWGCWQEISNTLLPGQAQISTIISRREEVLRKIAVDFSVLVREHNFANDTEHIFFNAKDGLYGIVEDYGPECQYGNMFKVLKHIIDGRDLQDNGCEQWCSPSEYQNSAVSKNEDFRIAIKSKSFAKLSQKTRQELSNVPKEADTGFIEIFDSMNDGTVEIVEINDPKNPAKLFSIPGDKVYGVGQSRHSVGVSPCVLTGVSLSSMVRTKNGLRISMTFKFPTGRVITKAPVFSSTAKIA